MKKVFGERLRALRGDRSQSEFATLLGIANQPTYARYEAGRIPKEPILSALAAKLSVTREWLTTGDGEPPPDDPVVMMAERLQADVLVRCIIDLLDKNRIQALKMLEVLGRRLLASENISASSAYEPLRAAEDSPEFKVKPASKK